MEQLERGGLRPRSRASSPAPTMPAVHRRLPSRDAELGKRDDNYRPRARSTIQSPISAPWRWRKRRVFMVLLGLALLYAFVRNIPTDLGSIDERVGKALRPGHVVHGAQEAHEPKGAPPQSTDDEEGGEESGHFYNGPIKFYRLATTLRGISRTLGSKMTNRNVLFAASSLKSVANLMPMACEMGAWERNYVHMAVLGRDPMSLEDILEINHVTKDSCTVYFHDARADYAEFSSDARAEVSVAGAMKHIIDFMHPQAIIMDDSSLEDQFFTRSMRRKARELRRALIEIPAGRHEDFLWLTRLDSGSLASWFNPTIDILVHSPPDSSGGLIRLVKSLLTADYTGLRVPNLLIELPSNVEDFIVHYLQDLEWPPDENALPVNTQTLSLRHRISTSGVNSEQASIRFLESFYPSNVLDNHVLVLSPHVELDPLYLHYLQYIILEYRYSAYGTPEADDLMGLALDTPRTFLNGTSGFNLPTAGDMTSHGDDRFDAVDESDPCPFLYQAPSSSASLIFGDKWATFHDFLKNRIRIAEAGKASKHKKAVSETEPAWMEYLLELMIARGWNMLHPALPFVTVHNDLARVPEEYSRKAKEDQKAKEQQQSSPSKDTLLTAPDPPKLQNYVEQTQDNGLMPLQDILPFEGDLPELSHLPHLYHTGSSFDRDEASEFQQRYEKYFRRHLGGCDATEAERHRIVGYLSSEDLFCLPGVEPDYVEDMTKEAEVAQAIAKAPDPSAAGNRAESGAEGAGQEKAKLGVETKEEVKAQE